MNDSINKPQELNANEPLVHLLEQFEARIDGLTELLDALSPHVAALDRPEAMAAAIDEAGFSPAGNALARAIFMLDADVAEGKSESEVGGQAEGDSNSERIEIPGGAAANGDSTDASDDEEMVSAAEAAPVIEKAINSLLKKEPEAVMRIFRRAARGSLVPREGLLNGSLLTVAVATFESLLAGVYREHLVRHPKQLESDEKEFSLGDLLEYGSVDEARRVLIERRTDSFMRKGVSDWSAWSSKTLGFDFSELALDLRATNEVFQRRHLIVHTGSVVSQLYLDRVDFGDETPPQLGSEIQVDGQYLRRALEVIYVLGVALTVVALSKWDSETHRASNRIVLCTYDLMRDKRWPAVQSLCEIGEKVVHDESRRWVMRVNAWLAARALGDGSEYDAEIAAWDVSALDVKFKLAKAALQGQDDGVFEFLPGTLESMGDEAPVVPTWPLLEPFRADERFKQIVEDAGLQLPDAAVGPGGSEIESKDVSHQDTDRSR